MKKQADITGVVLVGGKSSRMGENKALMRFGDKTFVERAIHLLQQTFENVIISANESGVYDFVGLPIVGDVYRGCGPLAGLHAAMTSAGKSDIFVMSCDLPFVDESVVRRILDNSSGAELIVAGDPTGVQPLCGLYRQSSMRIIEGQLRVKEYSVLKLVQHMKGRVILFEEQKSNRFININTPADYNSAVALLNSP